MSLFGHLFGNLFGNLFGDPNAIPLKDPQPLTVEFLEMAVELIDDFVEQPNATWISVGDDITDEETPYETKRGPDVRRSCKIVFLQDTLEDRQILRYLKGTNIPTGKVNGIMYPQGFTPTLKDIVEWQGDTLLVNAVDEVAPVDYPILYVLEFDT